MSHPLPGAGQPVFGHPFRPVASSAPPASPASEPAAPPAPGQRPGRSASRPAEEPAGDPAGGGSPASGARLEARGKFLFLGGRKHYLRGVTYGPFRPRADGSTLPPPELWARDLERMAAAGINAIRTYDLPPRAFLDAALAHGLRVWAGLPWEQHVAFEAEPAIARRIERRVREGAAALAGHPGLLAWAFGNEIPSSIVRWHGAERVSAFLERLCRAVRAEDPAALCTYVNYPTTEYLDLPFLDIVSFNVYLEDPERYAAYLARLQNLAGDRPLVLGELGLDARRHGDKAQARALDWQVRLAFAQGAAGAFVFAWTDEWHRGGEEVSGWDFGLTRRDREPRPALATVATAFAEVPFPPGLAWPRISVVVCSHNGARTLEECLSACRRIDYPDYETIVVDDGSHDATAAIAGRHPVRLIRTPHQGLSAARNTGLAAASGTIVVYLDDDAYPDPQWLRYLAHAFATSDHAGIGGPNLPPAGDGLVAECVADAPGGPIHVLLTDVEAEHIPGCNMAFRVGPLRDIGGFDRRYRSAGDDVDVCWRLQERGHTLGFHPGAMVWHHRRGSVRAYLRQQRGYGRAEALLEQKWPERYNGAGHLAWSGRLYGKGFTLPLSLGRQRIYQGTWGSAPFQSIYQPAPGMLACLPLMPEWYLLVGAASGIALLGWSWAPAFAAAPLALLGVAITLAQSVGSAARLRRAHNRRGLARLGLTTALHFLQPIARLSGRLAHGLTPWRRRGLARPVLPIARQAKLWSETWSGPSERLHAIEKDLRAGGAVVLRGGDYDDWDLELRGGMLGGARVWMAIEEHGQGRQLVRFGVRPRGSPVGIALGLGLAWLGVLAGVQAAPVAAVALGGAGLALAARVAWEAGAALATVLAALGRATRGPEA